MTDEQIKHMVNRFLGWRLPENFSPDAGISFKQTFNEHLPQPMKHEPVGTNLFDAQQAEQMVRYMMEGLPGNIERLEKVNEELVKALESFAEEYADLTNAMCHRGLCSAEQCGRCGKVIAARAALKLAKEPA